MVRDCQPDDIGMSVSYPLPGTKFHERVKSELTEQIVEAYHGEVESVFFTEFVMQ